MYCSETVPLLSCISFLGAKTPTRTNSINDACEISQSNHGMMEVIEIWISDFLFSVAMFRPHTRIILLAYGQR